MGFVRYAHLSVPLVRGFAKELGDKKWRVWCETQVIGIFVRELAHLRKLSSGARGAVRYLVRFARWANLSTDSDVVRIVCACDFGFQMSVSSDVGSILGTFSRLSHSNNERPLMIKRFYFIFRIMGAYLASEADVLSGSGASERFPEIHRLA